MPKYLIALLITVGLCSAIYSNNPEKNIEAQSRALAHKAQQDRARLKKYLEAQKRKQAQDHQAVLEPWVEASRGCGEAFAMLLAAPVPVPHAIQHFREQLDQQLVNNEITEEEYEQAQNCFYVAEILNTISQPEQF